MKTKTRFLFAVSLLLMFQCAKQTAPTGGPQDTTPPALVDSDPKDQEINFKKSEIRLTLDEFIQLKNPREEIIITPSVGKKFEVIAKKNKVTLKLNTELKDSTTYSINFRESVQDITERNPAKIKIAFSTGTYIDSLSISGIVKEILTDKPVSNYTVSLVLASDTFNIFKHPGTWVTLTDKEGAFSIENLKAGRYFIYAFNDKNKNLIADSKSESYGFKSDIIELTQSIQSVSLAVQKLDATKFKLISSRPMFAYYNIRVSKSIVDYKITPVDQTRFLYSKLESDQATVKVYNTIPELDSLQIRFVATDSIQDTIDSLIYLKFNKESSTKDNMTAKIEDAKIFESNSMFSATISFSKPITQLLRDSLYIKIDSLNKLNFSESELSWNQAHTLLKITKGVNLPKPVQPTEKQAKLPENKINNLTGKTELSEKPLKNIASDPQNPKTTYQLILTKEAAVSVENDTVPQLSYPISTTKATDVSIISISAKSSENLIVQLLDKSFKVIDQTSKPGTYNFENIAPGNYMIRTIADLNKNGKWDTGNYLTKTPPEPIFYYTNPKGGRDFVLKANWHVGELLISY